MENNNPLDEFQNILAQQHQNAIKKRNSVLYDEIINAAKIIKESKNDNNLKESINALRERFKNEDLNQVTDIFIYCQSYLSSGSYSKMRMKL